MNFTKRYQVYLDSRSVSVLDEASELLPVTRSQVIREVVDAAAGRMGNLLVGLKPRNSGSYSWLDGIVGAVKSGGRKVTNSSQRVDDIYYDK